MDLNFTETTAPTVKVGRNVEPNPFDGKFPTKVNEDGSLVALSVTFPGDAEKNKETTTNLTGKARRAAARLDTPMTARVQISEEGTGRNVKTVFTVWTVAKIERKTKDAAEAATENAS
jgi:hypothetical protein